MNLTKNFASRRQSWRDSQQDRAKIFATVNLLLSENLGEIRGSIPARFWPPGLLLPGENLGEIRCRIAPRFWPPGFLLLGENLGEMHGGIPARFWPLGFLHPGENLGEIRGRILGRFWPLVISFPGGQNLAGIPTGFLPRSRWDPAKIPVLILQGNVFMLGNPETQNLESGIHNPEPIFKTQNTEPEFGIQNPELESRTQNTETGLLTFRMTTEIINFSNIS